MWTPLLPDIGEARLDALEAILKAAIPDLNTCLARDQYTSLLVSGDYPALTPDIVDQGDTAASWDPLLEGTIKVAICAGGMREGTDFEADQEFIDQADSWGMRLTLHTSIYVYMADVLRIESPRLQARYREKAQARLSGWCRGVLNSRANIDILLASQEFCAVGGTEFDSLTKCKARTGIKSYFQRSAGNITTYGVHVDHIGMIA